MSIKGAFAAAEEYGAANAEAPPDPEAVARELAKVLSPPCGSLRSLSTDLPDRS